MLIFFMKNNNQQKLFIFLLVISDDILEYFMTWNLLEVIVLNFCKPIHLKIELRLKS